MPFYYKITFFLFLGFIFQTAGAQNPCEITLPAQITQIHRSPFTEKVAKKRNYWICNQAKVIFRSGSGTFYVERGAKLTLRHGNYTVYLKAGATLVLGTRSSAQVIYEGRENVMRSGSNIQVSYQPCPNLVFDYRAAPNSPCSPEVEAPLADPIPPPPPPLQDEKPMSTNTPNTEISNPDTPQEPASIPPLTGDETEGDQHIIPSQAQVLQSGSQILRSSGNSQVYWICRGSISLHNGSNNTFYVEEGANLTIPSGSNNTIYIKGNTHLTLGRGQGNKVFYVDGVNLVDDRSSSTKFTRLFEMKFDYSQAPSNGCP